MSARWMWTEVSNMGPGTRMAASLANHSASHRVVLYCVHPTTFVPETWEWDGELWAQAQDAGPPWRHEAAMAECYDGTVLLFGGRSGETLRGDTWSWDGTFWTQVEDSGPSPRGRASVTTDPVNSMTMLHGGGGETDTWVWDGRNWTRVAEGGPALHEPQLAWDRPSGLITLFGPETSGGPWRTFVWAQEMWVELSDMGPTSVPRCAFSSPSGILAYAYETWMWNSEKRRWTEVQDMGPGGSGLIGTWDESRGQGLAFDGPQRGRTWRLAVRK